MNGSRFLKWIYVLLLSATVVVSLNSPLIVNAAKYAQVSREIVENHDWINLTIAGDAYDQKPPLLFWIGALFFHVFGISTHVWKMGFLFISLLGIFSTYRLGKLLYGENTGRFAALFWVTSLGFLYYHNDIHTDTLLADMVIFSIWQFAAFFRDKKQINFYAGVTGVGFAMLTKGPVGLAIPAFAVGIDLLCHRRWKEVFHPRWLLALAIVVAMITPALAGLYNHSGIDGIKFFFWTNNMGRITGSYYGHNSDPFFYLHTSLYILAPFTVLAVSGLVLRVKNAFRTKWTSIDSGEWYTLGAIILYLLILSVAKTKNPHYLVPLGPLFMILSARFTTATTSGEISLKFQRVVSVLNAILISSVWIVILLFVLFLFPEKNNWYWLVLGVFIFTALWTLIRQKGFPRQLALLSFTMLAFIFSLNFSFYPNMKKYHSPLQAVKEYNWQASPGEQIHIYKAASRYWEIFFYARNPGRYYTSSEEVVKIREDEKDWIFTDTEGKDELMKEIPGITVAGIYDHHSLSQITLPFLNPETRASKLNKRYLLHLP